MRRPRATRALRRRSRIGCKSLRHHGGGLLARARHAFDGARVPRRTRWLWRRPHLKFASAGAVPRVAYGQVPTPQPGGAPAMPGRSRRGMLCSIGANTADRGMVERVSS